MVKKYSLERIREAEVACLRRKIDDLLQRRHGLLDELTRLEEMGLLPPEEVETARLEIGGTERKPS